MDSNRTWWDGPRLMGAAAVVLSLCCAGAARGQDREPLAVVTSREQGLAVFERLPVATLERVVLQCDGQAATRLLDVGEAVGCSMALDTLLRRAFDGDFARLLAWWQELRASTASR